MVMTVSELAQIPHLRMRLVAGATGSDRSVAWAHASDLDAPWNWLAGGELLMKNGRTLPADNAGRVELLTNLAEVGASALVIGDDPDTPPHTTEFLDAADSLAIPVLTIPYAVSFVSVSRAVADASALDDARRLARTERIYEIVRSAVGRSKSSELLHRLEEELSCRLFLLDTVDARPVLESSRRPTPALRRAVREAVDVHRGSVPALLRLDLPDDNGALAVEVPYA
ncbi:MAG: PucR family transcriptional regulator ligand-binding domain-containing protein, partial [Nocardioidaceae bacterium]